MTAPNSTTERRPVTLPYGTLPVLSFLTIHSGLPSDDARNLLTRLRAEMRRNGPTQAVADALGLCGFRWHAAPSIEEDVAAVADALREPLDPEHPATGVLLDLRAALARKVGGR